MPQPRCHEPPEVNFNFDEWCGNKQEGDPLPVEWLRTKLRESRTMKEEGGEAFVGDPISKVNIIRTACGDPQGS